jgi:hypothetical protein
MRKKLIWIIASVFIILFILIVKPIRTKGVMENIAMEMLMKDGPLKLFTVNYEPIYEDIKGPIITERQEIVEYTWYKVLNWGDTASISAYVYKNFITEFLGIINKKNPVSASADGKWYYVYLANGISKFEDILSNQHKKSAINFSKYQPFNRKNEIPDSIKFTIGPDRLFYFLQKGYFTVLEKNDTYTIVEFYEPIANIVQRYKNDTMSTMSAKVYVDDSLKVHIMPNDSFVEIRK